MSPKTTIEQLRKAREAIDKAIAALEISEPKSLEESGALCAFRGEPLSQSKKVVRGLCTACYSLLKERVDKGETTWAQLEAEGKAKPAGKSGRKPITIDADQYNARRLSSRKNKKD